MINGRGKVVTKKESAKGMKFYANIASWVDAIQKARNELGIKGFCAVNGATAEGKALYAKAKLFLAARA